MTKFDLTNPTIESDLSSAGITVETNPATGQVTGLLDNGQPVNSTDISSNSPTFADIEKGLPEIKVGELESLRPDMYDNAGVSFDILKDTPNDNPEQDYTSAIDEGAQGNAPAEAAIQEEESAPTKPTPTEAQTYNAANGITQDLTTAENDMTNAVNNGESVSTAAEDAASKVNLGSPTNINIAAQDACMVKKAATVASKARVPEIMSLLIRGGFSLLSLASQINSGHVTGKEVSTVMSIYNGKTYTGKGPMTSANEPFSDSAAWQRVTGHPVTSQNPGILSSSLPTANFGTKIVNTINSIFSRYIPGSKQVCAVENSPFSTILNIGGLAETIFGDTVTFGLQQVVETGAIVGFQLALQKEVIPLILQYFTPVGLLGHANSVQQFNNADAGVNIGFNNYSRSMGGVPQTNSAANQQTAQANNAIAVANKRTSLSYRLFALSNPSSLISKLALDIPLETKNSLIYSVINYITKIPVQLIHNFSTDFLMPIAYANQPTTNPGLPYGVTQYSFSNGSINRYDPISNEQYLFQKITYKGQSARRITMLGNPNTFVNSPAGDPNNNDLLHCFVDPFSMIEESNPSFNPNVAPQNDPGADKNCGVIGMYDYQSNPISATDMPNNNTVASIYCSYLNSPNQGCINYMISKGLVNNDVNHFRQYLLDLHVMKDYMSLMTNG